MLEIVYSKRLEAVSITNVSMACPIGRALPLREWVPFGLPRRAQRPETDGSLAKVTVFIRKLAVRSSKKASATRTTEIIVEPGRFLTRLRMFGGHF